ncbi:MAG TPA: NAD(P)H-dependent oxidoreductase [Verrucomicrobiota bacterium]|nr:NAD(P)H-dependent oxidoreductase [Verrucomicrobiota bacterium]
MNNSLALLGSLRSDGNTAKALHRLIHGHPCDTLDLRRQKIAHFSYAQKYEDDDAFIGIVERIVLAPVTIFATPVYWYSYSTPMKIFIDRFSDLLVSQKPLGRRLRGCHFALLSTGSDPTPDATLTQAFDNFCDYLGIHNIGMVYSCEDGSFYDEQSVINVRKHFQNPS